MINVLSQTGTSNFEEAIKLLEAMKGDTQTISQTNTQLLNGLFNLKSSGIISEQEFFKYATLPTYSSNIRNIISDIYDKSVIGEGRYDRVITSFQDGQPVYETLNGTYAKKIEELKRKFVLHYVPANPENVFSGTTYGSGSSFTTLLHLTEPTQQSVIASAYNDTGDFTAITGGTNVDGVKEILATLKTALLGTAATGGTAATTGVLAKIFSSQDGSLRNLETSLSSSATIYADVSGINCASSVDIRCSKGATDALQLQDGLYTDAMYPNLWSESSGVGLYDLFSKLDTTPADTANGNVIRTALQSIAKLENAKEDAIRKLLDGYKTFKAATSSGAVSSGLVRDYVGSGGNIERLRTDIVNLAGLAVDFTSDTLTPIRNYYENGYATDKVAAKDILSQDYLTGRSSFEDWSQNLVLDFYNFDPASFTSGSLYDYTSVLADNALMSMGALGDDREGNFATRARAYASKIVGVNLVGI